MKTIILCCLLSGSLFAFGQTVPYIETSLTNKQTAGYVSIWDVSSGGQTLGKAYTPVSGNVQLSFYPQASTLPANSMVVTGTYTSGNGKIAGTAYDGYCNQVGNPQDAYFKPNAYLEFKGNDAHFVSSSSCNAIPVYELVDNNSVLSDVVNARTKQAVLWRFFIRKTWTKTYFNGQETSGTDFLIVDFSQPLTLTQASQYVQGLRRCTWYHDSAKDMDFRYCSVVSACLLDTGTFRPFLLNGKSQDGTFPSVQSNVIVIR